MRYLRVMVIFAGALTLVWGGQSQLTNPASIDKTIERLAASAAEELHKQGLLR